jgi:hypothetical protein
MSDHEEPDDPDYAGYLAEGRLPAGKWRKPRRSRAKPKPDGPPLRPVQVALTFADRPRLVVSGEPGWADRPCFYVSVIDRNNSAGRINRFGLLAGPFPTHEQAESLVDAARAAAEKIDLFACFYGFGTCRVADGSRDGRLNRELGIVVERDTETHPAEPHHSRPGRPTATLPGFGDDDEEEK